MIENFRPAHFEIITRHQLCFDDGHWNGYAFECDENGNVVFEFEQQKKSLEECLRHPERYKRYNKVVAFEQRVTYPATGTCWCGTNLKLEDRYMAACQCPKCGQWYNIFGQELKDPKYWEEEF